MVQNNDITTKKTVVITDFNSELYSLIPIITNKKMEELLVLNSFGSVISQPYGCLIRNVILAVYNENVEDVYVIGEKTTKKKAIDKDELQLKMEENGIHEEVLKKIDYIKVAGEDVLNWLAESLNIEVIIKKNIELIQNHPLIPKSVSVYGFIADTKTREFEVVT